MGWHHIVVTCGENTKASALDNMVGRTRLITCYVDGSRFGSALPCSQVECPSLELGICLGNSSDLLSPLGEDFALAEVRCFRKRLTERTISSSVARSSFGRRPNWNRSSLDESRLTPAHIWARAHLVTLPGITQAISSMLEANNDDINLLGMRLIFYLATIPKGKTTLLAIPNIVSLIQRLKANSDNDLDWITQRVKFILGLN